ncbi:MAG: hypothetical protein HYY68_05820 [Thaumarchaeota archaeon]|nr:hypothetical protein [Nitrososphaerota archaeon]
MVSRGNSGSRTKANASPSDTSDEREQNARKSRRGRILDQKSPIINPMMAPRFPVRESLAYEETQDLFAVVSITRRFEAAAFATTA